MLQNGGNVLCGMLLTNQVHGAHPWQVQACQGAKEPGKPVPQDEHWQWGKEKGKGKSQWGRGKQPGHEGLVCHTDKYEVYTVKI